MTNIIKKAVLFILLGLAVLTAMHLAHLDNPVDPEPRTVYAR